MPFLDQSFLKPLIEFLQNPGELLPPELANLAGILAQQLPGPQDKEDHEGLILGSLAEDDLFSPSSSPSNAQVVERLIIDLLSEEQNDPWSNLVSYISNQLSCAL
jgi:hypothetical protein